LLADVLPDLVQDFLVFLVEVDVLPPDGVPGPGYFL
jgi:hypothetical protein